MICALGILLAYKKRLPANCTQYNILTVFHPELLVVSAADILGC
jgi:hypothetical protein